MQPHETALHEAIRAELAQLERLSLSYAMEQVPNATARANEITGSVLVLRAALARAAAAAERAAAQVPKMPALPTLQKSMALAPRKVVVSAAPPEPKVEEPEPEPEPDTHVPDAGDGLDPYLKLAALWLDIPYEIARQRYDGGDAEVVETRRVAKIMPKQLVLEQRMAVQTALSDFVVAGAKLSDVWTHLTKVELAVDEDCLIGGEVAYSFPFAFEVVMEELDAWRTGLAALIAREAETVGAAWGRLGPPDDRAP